MLLLNNSFKYDVHVSQYNFFLFFVYLSVQLQNYDEEKLTGSAVLYAIAAALCLTGALYSLVVMVHLFTVFRSGWEEHHYRRDDRSYTSSESDSYYSRRERGYDRNRGRGGGYDQKPGTGFDQIRGGYDRGYSDNYFGNRVHRY